jgi:alginate O-acetyltransferase complex protein AlgI
LFGLAPDGALQPLARYASREAIWAVAAGVVFSGPLWPWLEDRWTRLRRTRSARVATALEASGIGLEIGLVLLLLVACAAWLAGGTYNPFIYFRF